MAKHNWKINSAQKVFQTAWFSIDAVPQNSWSDKPYYRLSCNDSASILAKTCGGKIILVRQYRPAIEQSVLELPAGYVDKDESAEEAIKRELKEETAFVCDSVVCLGRLKIAPSRINSTLHIFYGNGARLTRTSRAKVKQKGIVLVTPEGFNKLILQGKYVETAGIAIFYLAQLKGYL
jgi:ADP-ribose pyrophosphatase